MTLSVNGRDYVRWRNGWARRDGRFMRRVPSELSRALDALAAERERCARIVESHANTEPDRAIAAAAAEIRSGK